MQCANAHYNSREGFAVASIPGEGIFDHCVACGHGKMCTKHLGGHGDASESAYVAGGYSTSSPISTESPAYSGRAQNGYNVAHATTTRTSLSVARLPVQATNISPSRPNGGGFSYGGGGNSGKRNGRKWKAPRGSGRCHKCNQTGHYARDCPNQ